MHVSVVCAWNWTRWFLSVWQCYCSGKLYFFLTFRFRFLVFGFNRIYMDIEQMNSWHMSQLNYSAASTKHSSLHSYCLFPRWKYSVVPILSTAWLRNGLKLFQIFIQSPHKNEWFCRNCLRFFSSPIQLSTWSKYDFQSSYKYLVHILRISVKRVF